MTETQLEKYEDAEIVHSDPWGIIDRNNRNHQKKLEYILDRAEIEEGDALLEVGCGAGLHSVRYASLTSGYHGIDISKSLVERTREKISQGSVQIADAHDTPFQTNTFNAVAGTAILHHLHDQAGALREWARITRFGGTITLLEPNYLFPKDMLTAHLVPEEKHKTEMTPWRLRKRLDGLVADKSTCISDYIITPRLYTPPWPQSCHGLFDRVDDACELLPGVKWFSQMLEIHIVC